jgi:hypothetical protein
MRGLSHELHRYRHDKLIPVFAAFFVASCSTLENSSFIGKICLYFYDVLLLSSLEALSKLPSERLVVDWDVWLPVERHIRPKYFCCDSVGLNIVATDYSSLP